MQKQRCSQTIGEGNDVHIHQMRTRDSWLALQFSYMRDAAV